MNEEILIELGVVSEATKGCIDLSQTESDGTQFHRDETVQNPCP